MNDRICISIFISLLLFSGQKRELIGRNGKAGFPTEKFFCVRNHGPLIIIVISVVPLSKFNKICKKKKTKQNSSIVFSELQGGLILTFIYFYLLTGPFFIYHFPTKKEITAFRLHFMLSVSYHRCKRLRRSRWTW